MSACDNKSKNKTLPINIEINRDFEENLIKKEEVKINIPVNWEVLAESDKNLLLNSLFENSQYKGNIDYLLTLSNSEINSYPSISVLIQKDYEITKLGINEFADMFINTLNNSTLTILDGMKGVITDHNDLGNYIDKKNQILYIINEGTVANVGQIKTIAAILFKKDYIISLTSFSPVPSNSLTIFEINFSFVSKSTGLFLRARSTDFVILSLSKTDLSPFFLITKNSLY